MSSVALRRRLAALEAVLGDQAGRQAASAEYDALVAELNAAVQGAKQRAEADDKARREAGEPRSIASLVERDAEFGFELGRIAWRIL
ncbi:hypothetical protein [Methylosinus sp. LW3]|uniref:hypothetical protein n=1 Tax=Methylosinus sp. LW3 TaxID=107635 RepID=UPI0004650C18|nr:hypothetical protein [Methylosinus sp. LW3]